MKHANPFKGEKLRKIRIEQCWSQRDLAYKLGFLSVGGSISKWELNRDRPTEYYEKKLCEFFKVSEDYFRK